MHGRRIYTCGREASLMSHEWPRAGHAIDRWTGTGPSNWPVRECRRRSRCGAVHGPCDGMTLAGRKRAYGASAGPVLLGTPQTVGGREYGRDEHRRGVLQWCCLSAAPHSAHALFLRERAVLGLMDG